LAAQRRKLLRTVPALNQGRILKEPRRNNVAKRAYNGQMIDRNGVRDLNAITVSEARLEEQIYLMIEFVKCIITRNINKIDT
jgi:hypothetical protein